MNRYVYYHYFIVCFTNLLLLIPFHLISERYNGSVLAIIISPFIGWLLMYLFTTALNKFPRQGLPEIFSKFYPAWVAKAISIYLALMIGVSAAMAIASYSIIITRFLNPEGNPYIILIVLMLVCAYGATRSTVTVNFILEIILILNIPLIAFLMLKTINNPLLNWDAIHVIAKHYQAIPSLMIFSCTVFFYTGYFNLGIFNRVLPPNFRYRRVWLFPIIGFIVLLTTFFVPIGIHGTETVSEYLFLWSATADSTRMKYGFIERVLFVFLIMLVNITLTFTIIGWHMMIEYIRSTLPKNKIKPDESKPPKQSYVIICITLILSYLLMQELSEIHVIQLGGGFLIVRMVTEIFFTIWVFLLSKKKRARNDKTEKTIIT